MLLLSILILIQLNSMIDLVIVYLDRGLHVSNYKVNSCFVTFVEIPVID